MFSSGVQIRTRLNSRLKHAGMTDFGLTIYVTSKLRELTLSESKIIARKFFPR
jgi:hypothetical protein